MGRSRPSVNQNSAACACGEAGISAGKVRIGPELVFGQGEVWVQLAEPLSVSPKPTLGLAQGLP